MVFPLTIRWQYVDTDIGGAANGKEAESEDVSDSDQEEDGSEHSDEFVEGESEEEDEEDSEEYEEGASEEEDDDDSEEGEEGESEEESDEQEEIPGKGTKSTAKPKKDTQEPVCCACCWAALEGEAHALRVVWEKWVRVRAGGGGGGCRVCWQALVVPTFRLGPNLAVCEHACICARVCGSFCCCLDGHTHGTHNYYPPSTITLFAQPTV